MDKYNGLLSLVANECEIHRGTHESNDDWKARLIYSICGIMAYASLWDESDDGSVSLGHFKGRVRAILLGYKSLYPELCELLPSDSLMLEREILLQYIKTGVVYRRPNRIAPSAKREELFGNILFQRGIALGGVSCVSGVGLYAKQGKSADSGGVESMFGIERENLKDLWDKVLSAASWRNASLPECGVEYLCLEPPFTGGYWVGTPNMTGAVSILRTGMKGSWQYYLYRYSGGVIEMSALPCWQNESRTYRVLACACLLAYGTLPPIRYLEDGALTHLHMGYLLPSRELDFLKLYSWPEVCASLPCDFRRKASTEVFAAIKDILSDKGYEFEEGIV